MSADLAGLAVELAEGARTILNNLRTVYPANKPPTVYSHVESRGGSLVHVEGFIAELDAFIALAARLPVEGWLPIESAPRDGTAVLGFWRGSLGASAITNGSNYGITAVNDRGQWYDASEDGNEDDEWFRPDAWRPLPAGPAPGASTDG